MQPPPCLYIVSPTTCSDPCISPGQTQMTIYLSQINWHEIIAHEEVWHYSFYFSIVPYDFFPPLISALNIQPSIHRVGRCAELCISSLVLVWKCKHSWSRTCNHSFLSDKKGGGVFFQAEMRENCKIISRNQTCKWVPDKHASDCSLLSCLSCRLFLQKRCQ